MSLGVATELFLLIYYLRPLLGKFFHVYLVLGLTLELSLFNQQLKVIDIPSAVIKQQEKFTRQM